MSPAEGQHPPESQGGDNAPQDHAGGQRFETRTAPQLAGRRATWTIGLILIPFALVFFALLAVLWPPPKPREGLTLDFERQDLEVLAGEPATYTMYVSAPTSLAGPIALQAVMPPETQVDQWAWVFAPHGADPKIGLLAPGPIRSRIALTLQTPATAAGKHYHIMVSATGGSQTQTITGRLGVKKPGEGQHASGGQSGSPQTLPTGPEQNAAIAREGFSHLFLLYTTFPHIPDEVRLFLIVAVVGCLGGLLQAIRSWFWYAGHNN